MTTTTAPGRPAARLPQVRGGLPVFWLLAFGLSWGPWAAALATGGDVDDPLTFALYALGGCGPSLAALLLAATGRRTPSSLRWGAAGRWLPAAVGLGVAPAVVTAAVTPLLGGPSVDLSEAARVVAGAGGLLAFAAFSLVAGPLAEELGWRGYAQPRLRRRLSPLAASALLGAVWSVWHLPLFLLDGTWQSTLGPVETVLFLVAMVPMSSTYWFVTERLHGGVPAAVVLHLAGNTALALLAVTAPVGMAVYVGVVVLTAVVIHLVTRP
ncbi:CPBP family intramembrane glutamic endopeptidase [Cellulosimicrobium sp. Marseille-Q8652]